MNHLVDSNDVIKKRSKSLVNQNENSSELEIIRMKNNKSISEIESQLFKNENDESDIEVLQILSHKESETHPQFITIGERNIVEPCSFVSIPRSQNHSFSEYGLKTFHN